VVLRRLILALAVLGLAAVPIAAVAHPGSSRATVVTTVTPFTADGHLRGDLRVVQQSPGTCGPGSDTLANDVYRCSYDGMVIDPCWRDYRAAGPWVVCLNHPWGRAVVRLRLASAPVASHGRANSNAEPWGVQLASGARCLAYQGAHDTMTGREGGAVIDYYCSANLALVRGIDRSRSSWTIRAARVTHRPSRPYTFIGRVAIKIAWFGGNNPLSHHP
jgi:hypothetical protein